MITQATSDNFTGPTWDNSQEYESIACGKFEKDLIKSREQIEHLRQAAQIAEALLTCVASLSEKSVEAIDIVSKAFSCNDTFETLALNLNTYINCILSLDGANKEARQMQGTLQNLFTEAAEAMQPVHQLLITADDNFLAHCLMRETIVPHQFAIKQRRWFKPHLLTLPEETLSTRLALNGPTAWGTLYTNISTSLQCKVETAQGIQTMGVARTAGLLKSEKRDERKAAYNAINSAWRTQQESCAAVLNSLSGWRLDLYKRRSNSRELHFLDTSLHAACIQRETLEAMMLAVNEAKDMGRKALQLRARALKIDKMGPWDLFAPPPSFNSQSQGETLQTFEDGIEAVRASFAEVDGEMGHFVAKMAKEKWIEASVGDRKRPGAYCTSFRKSRSPLVYMTYRGSQDEIGTLAHELGHAFHYWTMRDLHPVQTACPMTLAETASIFAETLVNDKLSERCKTPQEMLSTMWGDISNIDSLLLNIPARFAFEKELYEKRDSKIFNPTDLCELMRNSWETYYGDALSEMDDMFWASKLHFHMAGSTFYNFPYTFGYLFSLGIYAQSKLMGSQFYPSYTALLRDTGCMTAEDLAQKHLGVDIKNPHFWRASIAIARTKLALFENILRDCRL